jgi:hypothetical protein
MADKLILLREPKEGVPMHADGRHLKAVGWLNQTSGDLYADAEGATLLRRMDPVDHVMLSAHEPLRDADGHVVSIRALAQMAADHYYREIVKQSGMKCSYTCRDPGDGQLVRMDLGVADVHTPATLPNFAGGYRIAEGAADIASPPLLVGKQSNVYYVYSPQTDFSRKVPNTSAPGGGVAEINPSLSPSTYSTVEFALGGLLTTEVASNADTPLRPFAKLMQQVVDALRLEREIRVAGVLQTSGSWNANLVQTLAAGSQWDGGASSDPVANIHRAMEQSYMPITGMVMSELVWHDFLRNPAVQKYFGFKDSVSGLPTEEEIERTLKGLPPIHVASMKYLTGGAATYVWGNHVVLLRQPPEFPPTTQMDIISNLTFRWNGGTAPDGTAQAGGFLVRSYWDPKAGARGGTRVVCVINDTEVQTSAFVGGLILSAHQ